MHSSELNLQDLTTWQDPPGDGVNMLLAYLLEAWRKLWLESSKVKVPEVLWHMVDQKSQKNEHARI